MAKSSDNLLKMDLKVMNNCVFYLNRIKTGRIMSRLPKNLGKRGEKDGNNDEIARSEELVYR